MRAKKLLTSRQIFRYAVPAHTVTKKALHLGLYCSCLFIWDANGNMSETGAKGGLRRSRNKVVIKPCNCHETST